MEGNSPRNTLQARPRLPAANSWDPTRPAGALLPKLPPHAASPRAGNAKLASFALGPVDEATTSGWLACLSGGNRLPLPVRLNAASAEPRLGSATACARQLTAELTRIISQGFSAREGLPNICAVLAQAVGAEAAAVLPANAIGIEACLGEHNFDDACKATLAAAPVCVRLATSIPHEVRAAADSRSSLNLGGAERTHPAATDVGQVAIREPQSVAGAVVKVKLPPLHSALVTPVADPNTGSTIALLICCNSTAGRFALHDELFAEQAALHVGLLWLHHLQLLRLVPLPGAPLAPPDIAGLQIKQQWQALVESRSLHRERRAQAAHALERVGGPSATPSPIEALCRSCRRVLMARSIELRHAMVAVAAPSKKSLAALHEQLLAIGEQWAAAALAEIKGEAARLGGAEAAELVHDLMQFTVQAMIELAAHYHAHAPRGAGAPGTPSAKALVPSMAPAVAGAPPAEGSEEGADADDATPLPSLGGKISVKSVLDGELEKRVVLPVLRIATPVLQRLPFAYEARAAQVRGKLAHALLSEEEAEVAKTADLVNGKEPPLLSEYTTAWEGTGGGAGSKFGKELRDDSKRLAGSVPTEAAASALDELVATQGSALRTELSETLQGACLLLESKLEQQCWEVAGWVEVALNGRLSYRDKMMELVRAQFPSLLRVLVAGVLKCAAPPADARFAARHKAATASAKEATLPEPPAHAEKELSATAASAVDEYIKMLVRAIDPLAKQFPPLVSQIRPRVIKLRLPLRESLVSLLAVCCVHPLQTLPACNALRRAADAVESSFLALEPKLLPLASQGGSQQPIPPEGLAVVIRKAIKSGMLGEMPQLAATLTAVLAMHGHDTPRFERLVQQLLNGWSERCYAALLSALTDFGGAALSEAATPVVAKLLPAAAQRLARDLHRDARLAHADSLAALGQRLHAAEGAVMRAMAAPFAAGHAAVLAERVVRALGVQLAEEIDAIVKEVVAAKFQEQKPQPKEEPAAAPTRRRSISNVVTPGNEETEDGSATAAAADIAASFGELQRATLRGLLAQVFARPVIGVLERALTRVLELGDWQWAESMTPQCYGCVRAWLASVHARISRGFLPRAMNAEESRILHFTQTTLNLSQTMLKMGIGIKQIGGEDLNEVDDGLVTSAERAMPLLRESLEGASSALAPSPALNVLLHLDSGAYHPPTLDFASAQKLDAAPSAAHAWALGRSRQLCLVDDVLAGLDAAAATRAEDGLDEDMASLTIEGDPSPPAAAEAVAEAPAAAAAVTASKAVAPGEGSVAIVAQPGEGEAASAPVLTHLTRTFWTLLDGEWELPSLMRTLADAVPATFERPISSTLYVTMGAAPAEHRQQQGALSEQEQLFALSVGAKVQEERVMRLLAAPSAVRIALSDGSRAEEVLEELAAPSWFDGGGGEALPVAKEAESASGKGGSDGTVSSHRLFVPVRCSSLPKPIAVLEIALHDGKQMYMSERDAITRLVSAFGGAATRCHRHAATSKSGAAAQLALSEEREKRKKQTEEGAKQRVLLQAAAALLPLTQDERGEASTAYSTLAKSLRAVTGASKVTIFAAPSPPVSPPPTAAAPSSGGAAGAGAGAAAGAGAGAASAAAGGAGAGAAGGLKIVHNDFASPAPPPGGRRMSVSGGGGRRPSMAGAPGVSPPLDDLPHTGIARSVAERKMVANVADPYSLPESVFDGSLESSLGFTSSCVCALPIMHAGDLLGVVQLTNKVQPVRVGGAPSGAPAAGAPAAGGGAAAEGGGAGDGASSAQGEAESSSSTESLLFGASSAASPSDDDASEAAADEKPSRRAGPPPVGFSEEDVGAARRLLATASRGGKSSFKKPQAATTAKAKGAPANEPPLTTLPNVAQVIGAVQTIAKDLAVAHTLRALLSVALRSAARLIPAQKVSIYVTGEDDGSMVRAAQPHDELGKAILNELEVTRVGDAKLGIVGRVLCTNVPACVQDTSQDPDFNRSVDCAPGYVINSLLCSPVVSSQGRVLAAVLVCNKEKKDPKDEERAEFSPLDADTLSMFAALLGPCLERQLMREGFEG